MLKGYVVFSLALFSANLLAANPVDLYQAPLSSLKQFPIMSLKNSARSMVLSVSTNATNGLQEINQTLKENQTIIRYQQTYKGIPIVGSQVMITQGSTQGIKSSPAEVNGHLLENIQVNIEPAFNAQKAIDLAKKNYFTTSTSADIQEPSAELQLRVGQNNELTLTYLVSFKSIENEKPVWPFFIIDAETGLITQQWNNIKTFMDSGPGGNEKTHEYWYGQDGLPGLDVTQKGSQCVMETTRVKLIHLDSQWDWANTLLAPFQYPCNNSPEENINGGYSPVNDAYYFGHTIVDMYKNWYGLNALQNSNGTPMKLIMRVHFGERYDNAFWDGKSMSFGDGQDFYPLVSLDVAGHEVSHGFTEQHSGLEYHDQSGALNEAFSDMAGQASRAYLLETMPQFYSKAYLNLSAVTWGIGETIVRDSFGKALRFMDFPSLDGSSADCFERSITQSSGVSCGISYSELLDYAKIHIANPQDRQNYIVHSASGIFNKAFYLLSNQIGIKKAYHVMIIANTKYWTPISDFKSAACGVVYAGKELKINSDMIKSVFQQVGVATTACSL
jgi:vibriolysin